MRDHLDLDLDLNGKRSPESRILCRVRGLAIGAVVGAEMEEEAEGGLAAHESNPTKLK